MVLQKNANQYAHVCLCCPSLPYIWCAWCLGWMQGTLLCIDGKEIATKCWHIFSKFAVDSGSQINQGHASCPTSSSDIPNNGSIMSNLSISVLSPNWKNTHFESNSQALPSAPATYLSSIFQVSTNKFRGSNSTARQRTNQGNYALDNMHKTLHDHGFEKTTANFPFTPQDPRYKKGIQAEWRSFGKKNNIGFVAIIYLYMGALGASL